MLLPEKAVLVIGAIRIAEAVVDMGNATSAGSALMEPDHPEAPVRVKPSVRLGIRAIDDDHAMMDRQMALFMELLDTPSSQEALAQAANDFFQMTMRHFEAEERLMETTAYPDLDRHSDQHALLMRILLDWWRDFINRGEYDLSRDDRAFLVEWFEDHIDTEDRWLAEHMRKQGHR